MQDKHIVGDGRLWKLPQRLLLGKLWVAGRNVARYP